MRPDCGRVVQQAGLGPGPEATGSGYPLSRQPEAREAFSAPPPRLWWPRSLLGRLRRGCEVSWLLPSLGGAVCVFLGAGSAWGRDVVAALALSRPLEAREGGQAGVATCPLGLASPLRPDLRDPSGAQAQRDATSCMSPTCRILGVTRVPGTGCSREGLGPVAPELLIGLRPCARAPGAWHVWPRESPLGRERVRPAVPRSPGPSGMQAPWQGAAGAWHLVIKSSGRERSRRCRTVVV